MTKKYFTTDELWMLNYLLLFALLFIYIALSYGAYLEEDLNQEDLSQMKIERKYNANTNTERYITIPN